MMFHVQYTLYIINKSQDYIMKKDKHNGCIIINIVKTGTWHYIYMYIYNIYL